MGSPVAAAPIEDSELARASRRFGRVDDEGRVFVVDGGTERELGVWQAGVAAAGLDFYVQRHLALCAELDLVEQRLRSRKLAPGEALAQSHRHEQQVEAAPGVGDLPALRARTAALRELADEIRAQRAAEKAAATEQARTAKEAGSPRRRNSAVPTTGVAGWRGSGRCSGSGRNSPVSTVRATMPGGTGPPRPGRRTPAGARFTSAS